ncbi:MAG: undecaprenyl/decaprenyl-phosphate alpha-N-acetylglucosaminyl 1-phosphate transferase [Acidobacteriota bacterium]|nr:undecaprenyl/decaprenyl-phosphate alpha-N-acetylglucosaminyl 1-phosphate transferase [Acidobacteriota bacterium]
MRYWDAVFAFLVATAVAALLTPLAGRLARRVGAIAYPSDRGLARTPTPELGGLAILAAVLIATALWLPAKIPLQRSLGEAIGSAGVVHTWPLIGGAALIALIGALDDAVDLMPLVKLLGQIGAAIIAATAGGAVIKGLQVPFVGYLAFPDGGRELSVIWLVALMNIVNFSDGVDGLAAGVCTIDGAAFSVIAFNVQGGKSAAAVLAAITAGASLGFLFHNRYPAKIFMGDTGSNLLGYLLGVAAVIGSLKTNAVVALAVPLLVLAVPFLDTGFVVAKRLKYRKAPWQADAEHFHHRMARIGFSQTKTVVYLYTWTLMLAGVALALNFIPYKNHHAVGHYHLGWSILMGAILLFALIASVYLVYVLEIFKFKSLRTIQLRRVDPDTSEHDIVASVERDIETGEFDAIKRQEPHE